MRYDPLLHSSLTIFLSIPSSLRLARLCGLRYEICAPLYHTRILTSSKVWGEAYQQSAPQYFGTALLSGRARGSSPGYQLSHFLPSKATASFRVRWPYAEEHPLFYVGIFAAIGSALVLSQVVGYLVLFSGSIRASRRLFKQLVNAIMYATVRWHDVTPQGQFSSLRKNIDYECSFPLAGRILNRLGKVLYCPLL
jgi:hypothetical protein